MAGGGGGGCSPPTCRAPLPLARASPSAGCGADWEALGSAASLEPAPGVRAGGSSLSGGRRCLKRPCGAAWAAAPVGERPGPAFARALEPGLPPLWRGEPLRRRCAGHTRPPTPCLPLGRPAPPPPGSAKRTPRAAGWREALRPNLERSPGLVVWPAEGCLQGWCPRAASPVVVWKAAGTSAQGCKKREGRLRGGCGQQQTWKVTESVGVSGLGAAAVVTSLNI